MPSRREFLSSLPLWMLGAGIMLNPVRAAQAAEALQGF